jgi:hypothetical protein
MKAWIEAHRTVTSPFDYVIEAPHTATPEQERDLVPQWAAAGATWWISSMWGLLDQQDVDAQIFTRLEQGPPKG